MQNNGNKLCASHNRRFNNGERPRAPTTVAGADTAAAVHTTTTTAKSQSKSKISKDKEKTSPKPRRSKTGDEEKIKVSYYLTFPEQKRGEPAAVVGANAGLKNSNVVCYSNAIFQCLASCICLSDFSPSENHTEFELNHAFACLMNSMVKGGQSIDLPHS